MLNMDGIDASMAVSTVNNMAVVYAPGGLSIINAEAASERNFNIIMLRLVHNILNLRVTAAITGWSITDMTAPIPVTSPMIKLEYPLELKKLAV